MKEKTTKSLVRKLSQLRGKINGLFPLMRGSVVIIGTKNKQPYYSLNKNQKTHLVYLGKNRLSSARKCSENYKKMAQLVDEMSLLNMELFRRNIDPTKLDHENF